MTLETICDECEASYKIKHDLGDKYIPSYCPFCGADIPLDLGEYLQEGEGHEEWED